MVLLLVAFLKHKSSMQAAKNCPHGCEVGFSALQLVFSKSWQEYSTFHEEWIKNITPNDNGDWPTTSKQQEQWEKMLNQLSVKREEFIQAKQDWVFNDGPCFSGNCLIRQDIYQSKDPHINIDLMLSWFDQTISQLLEMRPIDSASYSI